MEGKEWKLQEQRKQEEELLKTTSEVQAKVANTLSQEQNQSTTALINFGLESGMEVTISNLRERGMFTAMNINQSKACSETKTVTWKEKQTHNLNHDGYCLDNY
ncbi:hypothetical protein L345_11783, partial [Ophiophagus hannah]